MNTENEYLSALFHLETVRLKFYYNCQTAGQAEAPYVVNRLLPSPEEIGWLLEHKIAGRESGSEFQVMLSWEEYFRQKSREAQSGDLPAVERLRHTFGLSEFGRSALALALMAEMDGDYRTILQFLQGNARLSYPTPEFCARLFFHQKLQTPAECYREAERELSALELLFPALAERETPYLEQMIPDRRLMSLILGDGRFLPPYLEEYLPETVLDPIFFREKETTRVEEYLRLNPGSLFWLYGEKGAGKKHFIKHLCQRNGRQAVFCHLSLLSGGEEEKREEEHKTALRTGIREAMFRHAPLVITGMEGYEKEERKNILRWLVRETKENRLIIFLTADEEKSWPGDDGLFRLEFPTPDENQRARLWEHYSAGDFLADDLELPFLINTFAFTPGRITAALQTARRLAAGEGGAIGKEQLYQVCYGLIDHSLEEKATRIRTVFAWDDLKLAREEKETLRDLCNRVKNKRTVMAEWGFSRKLPYGTGVSAVFAGPPGTGKTMAAQVVANELNMELYQIDLSQVVDKYIGETEKNIRLIFDQAKKSNSILFFDEADSLFGKRVENAANANDRFANIESSMLLQCIEQYSGISLLATNNYGAMDPAFIRRFKYLINFRMPDAELRLEIWKSVFPEAVPLEKDVDFRWLADRFDVTGAYIKNIALSAAFAAAEEGCPVNMMHILRGLKREMIKEGRMLEQARLESFGYLFGDL
ncbi:MAG TPA: AAA family ATPase [Bacillota bacterium]|nr:AAA family ATPase [Bacillota bacterium]